jgi:hypothetical protein
MDENNHLHEVKGFTNLMCTEGHWEWVKEDVVGGTHTDHRSFGVSQIISVEGTGICGEFHAAKENCTRWECNKG